PQRAQPVADVLNERFHQRQCVHLAMPLADLRHSSEPHARRSSRFFELHAAPHVLRRQHLQMRLQLLREFFIRGTPRQASQNPRCNDSQPTQHDITSSSDALTICTVCFRFRLNQEPTTNNSTPAPDSGPLATHHSPLATVFNTRPITPEIRSQLRASRASCFRPAFVME